MGAGSNFQAEDLKEKLNYLDLDFKNLPDSLTEFNALGFNISRINNDKDHKIYRFVPIDKIEILLTPCLREDSVKDKYNKAVPLYKFFEKPQTGEDEERRTRFFKMIQEFSVAEVENVAVMQKNLEKTEPFKVRYSRDHLWQIYYSEETDRYFMLVCTKESTFAEFFYLLKRKIAFSKKKIRTAPKIYVPINYTNYSENFLTKSEIVDLENYLWLFTKNWPAIFEVYSKQGEVSLQIAGDTFVYDNVKSTYKVKITEKKDAIKFYKLIKALFIMQTEIKNKYNFVTKIDSKNNLELYFGKHRLTYEMLADFIRTEFKIAEEEIKALNSNITSLEEDLEELKEKVIEKENEYLIKQKEISTYLECKKTFLGKVKYFFKASKINKKIRDEQEFEADAKKYNLKEEAKNNEVNMIPLQTEMEEKDYYTIEDLVTINSLVEKGERNYKNVELDIKAQTLRLENLTSKVNNAALYIEEIDKHKKSIFDFWKFSNKDEKLSLEMGGDQNKELSKNNIRKSFDFEMDFMDLGQKIDLIQRKKLSREETDSIFIAGTKLLYIINMLRLNDMNKEALEDALDNLKEEFSKTHMHLELETFDIFGNVEDDNRRVKYLGSRSHRETEKNKFKILNINQKIDIFDFTEKLQSIITYLEGAVPKITTDIDFSIFKVAPITEKIKEDCFEVYDLSIENALQKYEDDGEGALNLVKLNLKEDMPLLYFSNIIFFDNNNKTLPEGMDLSSSVLLDTKKFMFKLISKTKFRTNNYFTESNNLTSPKSKDIFVYEYDVIDKNKMSEEEEERIKLAETLKQTEIQDTEINLDEELEQEKLNNKTDDSDNDIDEVNDDSIDYDSLFEEEKNERLPEIERVNKLNEKKTKGKSKKEEVEENIEEDDDVDDEIELAVEEKEIKKSKRVKRKKVTMKEEIEEVVDDVVEDVVEEISDFDLDDLLSDEDTDVEDDDDEESLIDSIDELADLDESEEIIIGEVKPKRKGLFGRKK